MNAPLSSGPSGPANSRIALALAAVYLVWGSTYLAIRFALEGGFPPFLLGGLRFILAGLLMYGYLRLTGQPTPSPAQWRNLAISGALMLLCGNGLVNLAEQSVSSGISAVVVSSSALWMALFSALRGHHPSRLEWLGLGIGFLGVLWLSSSGSLAATPLDLAALLLAALAWSFGSIWSRGRDLPSPFMTSAGQMLCAGLMMTSLGLASGERFQQLPDGLAMTAFGYLVFFGSLVGFSAYVWLLHHVRPALTSSYAYVNPAIAVLLGALLAGERFGLHELLAMSVILAGVLLITLATLNQHR